MADEIEVSGVVVSCMPIGEYDKRVVIITAELGRIHAFARGARRTNSKLLAGTDPLTFGKFKIISGKNAYTLLEVQIVNYFDELKILFFRTGILFFKGKYWRKKPYKLDIYGF